MAVSMTYLILCLICIFYLSQSKTDKGGKKKTCKGIWRPEELVGKCFGFKLFSELPDHPANITKPSECRSFCCSLGDKCVSWQFETTQGLCKVGGIARLGLEATGTPDWCDPYPDMKWNGRTLSSRSPSGKCEWDAHLPKQCYGLGPERKSTSGDALNTEGCAEACCKDSNCQIWQELPGRGCYFSSKSEASCSKDPERFYTGGRKCIPGFCSGLEAKILGADNSAGNSE